MPLQSTGPISFSDISTYFGQNGPVSMSQYYGYGINTPLSGTISMSNLLNSSFIPRSIGNGLLNWYRADMGVTTTSSNTVSQWNDLTSNNRNATQTFLPSQPIYSSNGINNKPMVNFNGVNSNVLYFSTSTSTAYTVVGLLNGYGTKTRSFWLVASSSNPGGFSNTIVCQHSNLTSNISTQIINSNVVTTYINPSAYFTSNVPYNVIWTYSISGTTATVNGYVNGSNILSNLTVSSVQSPFRCSNMNLGGQDSDFSRTFFGGIGEFVMYNNVLSSNDRQKIEGYIQWNWFGNGNNLPLTHPYRSVAP